MAARTDQLTGLLNRRALLEWSEAQVSSARHAQALTVLMIDIDDAMRQIMRLRDQFGRFGGEEFVALLAQTDSVAARFMAEKLRERVAVLSLALDGGFAIQCTVSLGMANLRPDETSIDPVLSCRPGDVPGKSTGA
ncbi:MAG: GGDEF domain-containing protein [Comamonadaceae bacterium]|nr:GGDEF domain-containing protein [Comamonadaceae bacterium]